MHDYDFIEIRPYHLMCTVCRLGARAHDDNCHPSILDRLAATARKLPWTPITMRCNCESVYSFQNCGIAHDTPEGPLFNKLRDLTILQKMGMVPGDTRPAMELFARLLASIDSTKGICDGYTSGTNPWQGCALACSGNYERGHKLGLQAIVPERNKSEKQEVKHHTADKMMNTETLKLRPHHLLCMTCFHAGRETLEPVEEDNLFEAIDVIQRRPAIPITLISGCCEICPPCKSFNSETGWCITRNAMSLRDEKKDLDTLKLLGLTYGTTMPANALLDLIYDRIKHTTQVCGYGDGCTYGYEWTVCGGPDGNNGYVQGRAARLGVTGG